MTLSPCIYIVRCNFDGTEQETASWNEWYNGEKMKDMLEKPGFLGGQRFRAAGLDQRVQFLAIWHLAGPEALESDEYRRQWGFAQWKGRIIDWTRDLYTPADEEAISLEVPQDGGIVLRAFDVPPPTTPKPGGGTVRLNSSGLDRSWPAIDVEVHAGMDPESVPATSDEDLNGLAWETMFAPISAFTAARTP